MAAIITAQKTGTANTNTEMSKTEKDADEAAMEKKAEAIRQAFGHLNYTYGNLAKFGEEKQANHKRNMNEDWGVGEDNPMKIIDYDSVTQMVLALNSDKLDCAFMPVVVANYLKSQNPDYVVTYGFGSYESFIMGVRHEDAQLRDDINKAIEEMKTDGTLAELEKKYINNDIPNTALVAPAAGRKTLKVIVTGDYAPVDYIAPDGTPQGYNVAIMQKIDEKLGVNIEFVIVESSARLLALDSKRGDIIFWIQASHNLGTEVQTDEFGDKLIVTNPYLTCDAASVTRSQEKTDIIEDAFAKLAELVRE